LRVTYLRQIHAGCAAHPRIRRKCCAHLPREERARGVTFGPICTLHAIFCVNFRLLTTPPESNGWERPRKQNSQTNSYHQGLSLVPHGQYDQASCQFQFQFIH
jgi:hypothetical protein